jgi:nickel-dependent lactate racemase
MTSGSSFCLKSGESEWNASVPADQLLKIADKPRFNRICYVGAYFAEKLANSYAALKVKDAAVRSGKALIICDDLTRPTPTSEILPILSFFLKDAGVAYCDQMILFATGSHRPMTEDEARQKIGGRLWGKVKWASHDWNAQLARIGETKSGIPIDINPLLLDYSCIIGIGSVFPHRYCGWSGGGKIILPGVSGPKSISRTHWMPYYDRSIYLGSKENSAISDILSAAGSAGLSLLVQCVCDGSGNTNDIIIGEPAEAHREAIVKAESVMKVTVPEADVVIAQAWPEDGDLWQACKALYSAENVVSRGGHIIVAASLREGIGPNKSYAELMNASLEDILGFIDRDDSEGLSAAAAYVTHLVRMKASVSFVTDSRFSSEISSVTGLGLYSGMQDAVNCMLKRKSGATFSVLKEAPLLLPVAERRCNEKSQYEQ